MSHTEVNEYITVTKINIEDEPHYLMIVWQPESFDLYLYTTDNHVWKGRFSKNRMYGFSKNLHLSTQAYFDKVQQALSQQNDDYIFEMKTGFFYWKRKFNDTLVLEGFLPVEKYSKNKSAQPDLVEVLFALNLSLKDKIRDVQTKFNSIKTDFHRCLKDTEEFLHLKVEMEKSLCDKFLNLVNMKKVKLDDVEKLRKVAENNNEDIMKKIGQTKATEELSKVALKRNDSKIFTKTNSSSVLLKSSGSF